MLKGKLREALHAEHELEELKREIYLKAKELCRKKSFDLILVTGEPFILFKYGHKISKEFGIPWIADYRDVWTTLKFQNTIQWIINRTIFRYFESKYISNAQLITTAAPSYRNSLKSLYPNKRIEVVLMDMMNLFLLL